MGKTGSTGTYTSLCDGTTPGSPLLSDGAAVYTPGLSERRGGASTFYSNDKQGNLWTLNAANGGQSLYQDTTAFGALTASAYSSLTPFKFGGGNGCMTDGDTGLVLMGHRYYDTRIGRFITPDPAGDGNNWYAYAGNNPVNKTDPSGLSMGLPGTLGAPDQRYGGFGGADSSMLGDTDEFFASVERGLSVKQYTLAADSGEGGSSGGAFADDSSQKHESIWEYILRQFLSGGQADHHNFHEVPFGTVNPFTGEGGGSDGHLSKVSKDDLKKTVFEKNTNAEYSKFFGRRGTPADPSAGGKLSKQGLEAYRELARRQVEAGIDKAGVQADRILKINHELGNR